MRRSAASDMAGIGRGGGGVNVLEAGAANFQAVVAGVHETGYAHASRHVAQMNDHSGCLR